MVRPLHCLITLPPRTHPPTPPSLQAARQSGWVPIQGLRYRKWRWTITPRMQWQAATEGAQTTAHLALCLRQLDPMLRWDSVEKPRQEQGEPLFYASLAAKRPAAAMPGADAASAAVPGGAGNEYLMHIRPPPTPTAAQQQSLALMLAEQQKALRHQMQLQAAAAPDQAAAEQALMQHQAPADAAAAAGASPEQPQQQAVQVKQEEAVKEEEQQPQEQSPAVPAAKQPAAAVAAPADLVAAKPDAEPEQQPAPATAAEAAAAVQPAAQERVAPAPEAGPAPEALPVAAAGEGGAAPMDVDAVAAAPAEVPPLHTAARQSSVQEGGGPAMLPSGSGQLPQVSSQLALGSLATSEQVEGASVALVATAAPSESQEAPGQEQAQEQEAPKAEAQGEEPLEAPSAANAAKRRREAGGWCCSAVRLCRCCHSLSVSCLSRHALRLTAAPACRPCLPASAEQLRKDMEEKAEQLARVRARHSAANLAKLVSDGSRAAAAAAGLVAPAAAAAPIDRGLLLEQAIVEAQVRCGRGRQAGPGILAAVQLVLAVCWQLPTSLLPVPSHSAGLPGPHLGAREPAAPVAHQGL